jgi:hypothetical protein
MPIKFRSVYKKCRIITIIARIKILEELPQGHSLVPKDSQDRRQDHRIMLSRDNRLGVASRKALVRLMDNSRRLDLLIGSRYDKDKGQLTSSR